MQLAEAPFAYCYFLVGETGARCQANEKRIHREREKEEGNWEGQVPQRQGVQRERRHGFRCTILIPFGE